MLHDSNFCVGKGLCSPSACLSIRSAVPEFTAGIQRPHFLAYIVITCAPRLSTALCGTKWYYAMGQTGAGMCVNFTFALIM